MNKNKELAIVKKLTNVNDENRIVLNEVGWTSRIYIVAHGEVVFKFPKGKKWQEEFEHELSVLTFLKAYEFNVKIPLIKWIGENNSYMGFRGICGKSITTETIGKLYETQKRKIGTQIGLFLKTLHQINYTGKSLSNEVAEIEAFKKSFYKRKRKLKEYFNENEFCTIEKLVAEFSEKSAALGTEPVFCHQDLGYNNILLDDNLDVGIIDFGDAGIYDNSFDFIGLEDNIILDAAIMSYGDTQNLREKIAIRQQLLPLMEMLFLFDRKDDEGVKQSSLCLNQNKYTHTLVKEFIV